MHSLGEQPREVDRERHPADPTAVLEQGRYGLIRSGRVPGDLHASGPFLP